MDQRTTAARTPVARTAGALACAVLALGPLAACGGDGGDGGTSATSSSASSSSDTGTLQSSPTPGESSAGESSGSESTGESSASSTESPSAVGEKPAKDEVVAGLQDFYETQKPAGSEDLDTDAFAECMVDKGYEKWSVQTVTAVKDGKPEEIDRDDSASFAEYGTACTEEQQ